MTAPMQIPANAKCAASCVSLAQTTITTKAISKTLLGSFGFYLAVSAQNILCELLLFLYLKNHIAGQQFNKDVVM